jgi:hypothetical protein
LDRGGRPWGDDSPLAYREGLEGVRRLLEHGQLTISTFLGGLGPLYIFDARHPAGGASAHAHRILRGVQYSWALHHASALPSLQISSTLNPGCRSVRVRGAWSGVPSCTVASDRACDVAKCLRLLSSCQKQRDKIGSCLFLTGGNVLMFCKVLALEWRVRKQRRQSGLRPRVPARSSTRKLSNRFRAGAEIVLLVAFILPWPSCSDCPR